MTNSVMDEHVNDLLKRVEVRVPKLHDQLALAEIRERLVDGERELVCGICEEELDSYPLDGANVVAMCAKCYPNTDEISMKDILMKIARHSAEEPEVLRLVAEGLKRYKEDSHG